MLVQATLKIAKPNDEGKKRDGGVLEGRISKARRWTRGGLCTRVVLAPLRVFIPNCLLRCSYHTQTAISYGKAREAVRTLSLPTQRPSNATAKSRAPLLTFQLPPTTRASNLAATFQVPSSKAHSHCSPPCAARAAPIETSNSASASASAMDVFGPTSGLQPTQSIQTIQNRFRAQTDEAIGQYGFWFEQNMAWLHSHLEDLQSQQRQKKCISLFV